MTKRLPALLAAVCLALGLLAASGCAPDKTGATGEVGGIDLSTLPGKDISIVSHFDPGIERDKTSWGMAAKWWKETIGGKVNLSVISADIYPTRLMAMVGSGEAPDIIMVDHRGWMPRLAILDIIDPVDEYVKTDELLDYEKPLYDSLSWKGRHYSIMVQGAWAYSLWYNKTMFVNAGVKTPREYWEEGDWTWDTFVEVAQELTVQNPNGTVDQYGYANWGAEIFPSANNARMTQTNADGTVDVIWDQKAFMESAQFAADLINKYKVQPPELSYHVKNFAQGKVAMSAGANDFVQQFCQDMNDEVDVAPLPIGPNQDPDDVKYVGYSLFTGLGRGSKNRPGALVFATKMREFEKKIREENIIDPDSTIALLTQEQLEMCRLNDSKVVLNYESGFGDWENDRWNFWSDILFNGIPVSNAVATYTPLLQDNIKKTLDAKPVEIEPFTPVPAEIFEGSDVDAFMLNQKLVREAAAGITLTADSANAIEGSTSLKVDYPGAEDSLIIATTDPDKIKLPSFHRYKVTFDAKMLSDVGTQLRFTVRPKATVESDEVSYGYQTVTIKPGETQSFEFTIDVTGDSVDNVLLMIGDTGACSFVLDKLEITEVLS